MLLKNGFLAPIFTEYFCISTSFTSCKNTNQDFELQKIMSLARNRCLESAKQTNTAALATGGTALMALSMTTDAQAAIVAGTDFRLNGQIVGTAVLTSSDNGDTLQAFRTDGGAWKASWVMSSASTSYIGFSTGNNNPIFRYGNNYGTFDLVPSGFNIGPGGPGNFKDFGWPNTVGSGYIGVKIQEHYGWIEAERAADNSVTLKSWAYEDVPGAAIEAGAGAIPEPGSLSLLALGAAGLISRRRRLLSQ